jgi:hypothetical protein
MGGKKFVSALRMSPEASHSAKSFSMDKLTYCSKKHKASKTNLYARIMCLFILLNRLWVPIQRQRQRLRISDTSLVKQP